MYEKAHLSVYNLSLKQQPERHHKDAKQRCLKEELNTTIEGVTHRCKVWCCK